MLNHEEASKTNKKEENNGSRAKKNQENLALHVPVRHLLISQNRVVPENGYDDSFGRRQN